MVFDTLIPDLLLIWNGMVLLQRLSPPQLTILGKSTGLFSDPNEQNLLASSGNTPKCRIPDVTYPEIELLRQGFGRWKPSKVGGVVKNRLNVLFTVSKPA